MANREPKNLITDEHIEDVTQYGEFIASFHQWTTYENQQLMTHYLQDCAKPGQGRSVRK